MRFLRMLTNSLLAGAFGAAYLTILVLQLNPEVPLLSATTGWWFVTLGTSYGLHFAVILYVIIVAREFFTMDVFSPGWISVRLLAWFGAALAAGAATLMWLNVTGLALTLGEPAHWRMTAGAVATTIAAVVLLAIAVAHYSFGRRGSRVGASLFLIAAAGSMALPVAARGPARPVIPELSWPSPEAVPAALPNEGPRVTLMLLDGASLEHIWPRVAQGRLPNFSRVLERGAVINLASIRPADPAPVWAAVGTGRYPSGNGIRSSARYYALQDRRGVALLPDHALSHALVHFGFVRNVPLGADAWTARPLWGILTDAGMTSGIVRWPLTHPAPPSAGFVVSDRLHQALGSIGEFTRAAFPEKILPLVQMSTDSVGLVQRDATLPGFPAGSPEHTAFQRDLLYSRVGNALRAERSLDLFAIRYEGLDTIGHNYLRDAEGQRTRGGPDEERRRREQIVDRYYAFIDTELGAMLERMGDDDLVMVISGFGMERLNPVKRAIAWVLGDPAFTGTHDRGPDGFLLTYGRTVRPGARLPRGSLVDVTPTLLYFFGLPVARDMDGYARADLFTQAFTAERPITFIPSYR